MGSNDAASARFTVSSSAASTPARAPAPVPTAAPARDCSTSAATSREPAATTSPRWVVHAPHTPSSTWRNDGIPWRGSFGKYVPP